MADVMILRELPTRLAELSRSDLQRSTAAAIGVGMGLVALAVAWFLAEGTGRLATLAIAAALIAAQLAVVARREPGTLEWASVMLLQAAVPTVATFALGDHLLVLTPVWIVYAVWAALLFPMRLVLVATVWNAAGIATPSLLMIYREGMDPVGPVACGAVTIGSMLMAVLSVQVLAVAQRHSEARSYNESRTDPMTGLFNRRHTDSALHDELRLAERTGRPCGVLLVDIDHFKSVNDTHGHAAGDEVLTTVARRILGRARSGDIPTRWGGEEFMLVARDIPDHRALESLAEDVRASCAGTVRVANGRTISVTVSVGAALSVNFPATTAIVEAADRCLYEAKAAGRNCTRVAGVARALTDPSAPRRAAGTGGART
ncbi:MAG: GGDEF domain-containing protein [Actinobacteria bacterium]|nr:GGDEF domain-containing protein [Thermoleophilia bacterium]MCB9012170.1 GGDEF domain-containing protein [Actinomycetota bacterium]